MLDVRAATVADVPAIEAVYVRSWRAAYADLVPADRIDDLAELRRNRFDWARGIRAQGIADPNATVRVGVDETGRVLGVVQADLRVVERDRPELTMLYVDPDAWGTGLARRLHDEAICWLVEQGCTEAWLRVVDQHPRARRFYEREGWVLDGDGEPVPTDLAVLLTYRTSMGKVAR